MMIGRHAKTERTPRRWTVLTAWGLIGAVVILLLAAAAFMVSARSGWLRPSEAALCARYALPDSKFITIDGEPIHYVDQGSGDAIVLIHGSFDSLLAWNDWADALKGRYRVVRFDRPAAGLSGRDPLGRYDTARDLQIIQGLTAQLGIKRFFLVAVSSGGQMGAAYAAEHPDQIRGLILADIAVGPVKLDPSRFSPMFKAALAVDPWFNGWHPQALWRGVLTTNFADPGKVTPALVARWTDLNNRAQTMPRRGPSKIQFDLARTPGDLARITAPTLLLWSAQDHEVPLDPVGHEALRLLAAKDKTLIVVPHCGHMLTTECGPQSAVLAKQFFDRLEDARP
jgi:pimeloyl-ACP methyl ester carboxylesterase